MKICIIEHSYMYIYLPTLLMRKHNASTTTASGQQSIYAHWHFVNIGKHSFELIVVPMKLTLGHSKHTGRQSLIDRTGRS